jgi:hypothetical protein
MARYLSEKFFVRRKPKNKNMLKRDIVLNTLIKHETLNIEDLGKAENIGFVPDENHLQLLLDELVESKHVTLLSNVMPSTYTITEKGIAEGNRLKELETGANQAVHSL